MITANMFFKTSFEAYRMMVLIPAMVKKHIPEGYSDSTLEAYVNHGRWIVKCECGGAEKAWEEGFFMCQSCFNSKHKHQYRKSVFPQERREIEEILSFRPLENRNWYPRETLKQLEVENKEHEAELLEVM